MILDRENMFARTTGLKDGTAWSSLWAATTNIGDVIDLQKTLGRSIIPGMYVVWQVGAQQIAQAGNTTTFNVVCSAAANLGTPTVLWTSGALANTVVAAYPVNTIQFAVRLPDEIPLRYLGVSWVMATTAWTAGTMNIYLAKEIMAPWDNVV